MLANKLRRRMSYRRISAEFASRAPTTAASTWPPQFKQCLATERRALEIGVRPQESDVAELSRAIEEGRNPLILDARRMEIRLRDGMNPGAMAASPEDIDSIMTASRPGRTIVVRCACPNDAPAAIVAKRLKQARLKTIHPLLGGIDAWIAAAALRRLAIARLAAQDQPGG